VLKSPEFAFTTTLPTAPRSRPSLCHIKNNFSFYHIISQTLIKLLAIPSTMANLLSLHVQF
jgi:hypothetical protein